ncbi:MAG: sulfotransferase family protein [Bacteroidota bacterium]
MSLQVMAVGLPRTGTSSLKAALQMLGFGPCQHMDNLFSAPDLVDLWIELYETGQTDFNTLFADFHSVTDFPACFCYRELMAAYPDVKVILNYREPGSWYASMLRTIHAVVPTTPEEKAALLEKGQTDPRFLAIAKALALVEVYLLDRPFGGQFLDKGKAIQRYEQHYAAVRQYVPAPQLLEVELGMGWESICNFLEVEVPSESYPFKNKTNDFQEQIGKMITGGGELTIK